MAIEQNIMTPYVQENGFGAIDEARMARAIDQLAAALDLPSKPAVDDIWTDAFLPPAEERDLME
jgi:NitT/TauT family transport system substrate-binding protein